MSKKTNISIEDLMNAGCHFGHTKARWQPKMKPFIYLTRERVQILNLEKTKEKLDSLLQVVEDFVAEGKTLVLVGTKRQAQDIVEAIGKKTGMPYVVKRWLGGTMTNFETMKNSIKKMNETEKFLDSDDAQKITKRERLTMHRELVRMNDKFGGLKDIREIPQGLFLIDPSYEKNALKEARQMGIKVFALLDTNSNPNSVDEFVPANDDAAKSIMIIMNEIQGAIERGKKRAAVRSNVVKPEKKETKSKK